MDIMTCPQCRRKADRPMFLPRSQQVIFDFIWNNPWCTIADIWEATQTSHASINLISVQICKIRDNLVGTPFTLQARVTTIRPRNGRRPRQYRIEEVENANV